MRHRRKGEPIVEKEPYQYSYGYRYQFEVEPEPAQKEKENELDLIPREDALKIALAKLKQMSTTQLSD